MKLLGCAIFFSGCIFLCAQFLLDLRNRQKEYQTLFAFLQLMEREIGEYQTPLPAIYKKAAEMGYYETAFWKTVEAEGLECAWEGRMQTSGLEKRAMTVLRELCAQLGKSDRATQEKQCRHAKEEIFALQKDYQAQLPNRRRLYVTLCLCIGAMCLILLF